MDAASHASPPTPPASGAPPRATSIPGDPNREIWDGVTAGRPLDAVPTVINNVTEMVRGRRDERIGPAVSYALLASERMLQARLLRLSRGTGAVAAGSSFLGKLLPSLSIGLGVMQVWKGWNELQSHDHGPLSIIHSRTGREGLLQITAGGLLFVPGIGPAVGGAAARFAQAANEMDAFRRLDWPTVPIEVQNRRMARIAHPFDSTPHDPYDRSVREQQRKDDLAGRATMWISRHFL